MSICWIEWSFGLVENVDYIINEINHCIKQYLTGYMCSFYKIWFNSTSRIKRNIFMTKYFYDKIESLLTESLGNYNL